MKKYIFTVFAVAAVLSSCSKSLEPNGDINSGAKAITTIGASTEISTRAVVSPDGTKVNWEAGDKLGVLGANTSSEAKNLAYTLDGNGGSTSGTFKNESSDIISISAVMYPYQATASWDGTNSKLTCEIPSVQKATKGSFDKDAAVMYSIDNTTDANLNYAVNFLKVTVSETNVHAISISSTTTALSGKMEITSSSVTAASDGSLRGVTLIPATGNFLETGDYYIAVKAGNIENPTISYVYLNQTNHTATEKSKAGSGTLTFASGTNVKPISVDFNSGSVITRKAFQLWADGPYFAEYNVGASSTIETGTGMTFAEATAENFAWGPNWCTPSKVQMNELYLAARGNSNSKVTCSYCEYNWGDNWGFKFNGKETGYTGNSVFFPAQMGGNRIDGRAYYWSATADGSTAWCMYLNIRNGYDWSSQWYLDPQSSKNLVRPVLKN